jgi:hypothetical protein
MDTVGDKDAEEAVDHSFSRGAIHPPRCLSLKVEIHLLLTTHLVAEDILHLLLPTHPVAGDILRPCTRGIYMHHTLTQQKDMQIGMHVFCVDLTWTTTTPARRALTIYVNTITT